MEMKRVNNKGVISAFGVLLLCTTLVVKASKDDSYYPDGIYNPNTEQTMYWKDARNVLQDLSLFQSLSVKFHSCAWSEITDGDDDMEGGGEDDSWYYGSVRPYGANVAFSLYGTLLTNAAGGSKCSRSTYINSFYTTAGFTAFSNSMAAAGVEGFVYQGGSADGNGDDDATIVYSNACSSEGGSGDSGDDDSSNSFGVACTNKGNFAVFEYSGAYCQSNQVLNITDWMVDYNDNLKDGASCVEIYNADNSDDDGGEERSGSVVLLEQSAACSLDDIGGACPDPYWKLQSYARILRRVTGTENQMTIMRNELASAVFFFVSSFALLVASILSIRRTLQTPTSRSTQAKIELKKRSSALRLACRNLLRRKPKMLPQAPQ